MADLFIYDEDIGDDDFVCSAQLYLTDICKKGSDKTFAIMRYKGKEVGKLYLDVTFVRKGAVDMSVRQIIPGMI